MKKYLPLIVFLFSLPVLSFAQPGGKHILLEEFSTAPCGFCPDGDLVAADIVKNHPQVIWVTHHAGFGTDSMTVPESKTIAAAFTTGAPMAPIDRGDYKIPVYTTAPYIAVSRQKWDSICVAHLNDPPVVEIGITNQYNASTRVLNTTVNATFTTVPAAGDIRINLFLAEDNVVGVGKGYDQKNYYNTTPGHPYYQKGDDIPGYVHHHVMRKVPGGAWGVSGIIPSVPVAANKYSYTFSNISIPPSWKVNDIDVVAFISYYHSDATKRQVINSNHTMMIDINPGVIQAMPSQSASFALYPNPAADRVFVNGSFGTSGKMEITNIAGQMMRSFDLKDNSTDGFSVEGLSNGVYFYRVSGEENQMGQGKLLIMH